MLCSFIYRLIFSGGTGRFRTRKADGLLLSNCRFCCFLIITSISSGWMFLLRPHFLIRSLYCLGLILSQLLICNRLVDPYVASSPCRSRMNSITPLRVLFSYSFVISGLCASQSSAVYFRASFCLLPSGNIAWNWGCGCGCGCDRVCGCVG
jgi:hypothetical protein